MESMRTFCAETHFHKRDGRRVQRCRFSSVYKADVISEGYGVYKIQNLTPMPQCKEYQPAAILSRSNLPGPLASQCCTGTASHCGAPEYHQREAHSANVSYSLYSPTQPSSSQDPPATHQTPACSTCTHRCVVWCQSR
jgi:hypothetical protein